MLNNSFLGGKETSKLLGVHQRTLYIWDKKGKIETMRTIGNKRLYNVEKFLKENDKQEKSNPPNKKDKLKISYVRVSSIGQKDDLERQKKLVKEKYPNHMMIQDIGSGMNLNKKGIRKIINLAIDGRIDEVVVAYKDRLTRFGYELIEDIIKVYSGGKIIVINKKENMKPEEELAYDVLQLINIFIAKMNGIRKYNKKNNK